MTSQIKLTDSLRSNFIAARGSLDPKAAKKRAWGVVHDELGIPSDIRLKAELDNTFSPDYLVLKNADSGLPLWRMDDGRVVASLGMPVSVGAATAQPVTALNQSTAPIQGNRFATASTNAAGPVKAIAVDDLLAALRDGDDPSDEVYLPDALPAGFPGVTGNGVVLDTTDRVLYFIG